MSKTTTEVWPVAGPVQERQQADLVSGIGFKPGWFKLDGAIPQHGWPNDGMRQEALGVLDDIGIPLDVLTGLDHRRAFSDRRFGPIVGSYQESARYGDHSGRITLYDYAQFSPWEKYAYGAHEGAHAMSPFHAPDLYGGWCVAVDRIRYRDSVEAYLWRVSWQSQITGIYLNDYHLALVEEYRRGTITPRRLKEETFAILVELSLTNPQRLLQIQAEQQRVHPRYVNGRQGVRLTTPEGQKPPTGIDGILVYNNVLRDVHSLADLRRRRAEILRCVSPETVARSNERPLTRATPQPSNFLEVMLATAGIAPPEVRR